jgi:hypothetical protein
MKVKIPKELRALAMLVMSLIFASAIFEKGSILVGGIFLVLLICGVYVHYSVIQKGDYADYDVIG